MFETTLLDGMTVGNVVNSIIFLALSYPFYKRLFRPVFKKTLKKSGFNADAISFAQKFFVIIYVTVITLISLSLLGLQDVMVASLASLGIAGFAIGFAMKDVVSNVLAGFMIFVYKPFRLGDVISVENKYEGRVRDINITSTLLKTVDGEGVVIPNQIVLSKVVVNKTRFDVLRRHFEITLVNSPKIEKAFAHLKKALKKIEGVSEKKEPGIKILNVNLEKIRVEVSFYQDRRLSKVSNTELFNKIQLTTVRELKKKGFKVV
ncbi:MAG: mechanosensitive ion channel [Nanoarchaeota archaeon]|nr:mechanosensitive ion channel [Nanoarchaeota archaeon]